MFTPPVSMLSRSVNTWCLQSAVHWCLVRMLGALAKYFQDVSVLRRLLFAAVFLSPELPMFWEVVVEFATAGKITKGSVTPDQVRALIENIQALNAAAFEGDDILQKELIFLKIPGKKPLGIPLIGPSSSCLLCGCKLQLRKDRHASVVIYDTKYGTISGAHFHKFCPSRTCSFTQYYGYHSTNNKMMFNSEWRSLPYFISSRDTAFSLDILTQLDANLMIGQISFKQQADIYNYTHGYTTLVEQKSCQGMFGFLLHFIENIMLKFGLSIYFLICTVYSNDLDPRQCMDRR